MNLLCVVVFFGVYATSMVYGEIIKCCESNYSFEKKYGRYVCSDNPSYNSHIFTNTTNFLQNNTDGQCVEFFNEFYIFNISESAISQFEIVEEKRVYPKCCPINFIYNTFTHGCEEAKNVDYSEIQDNFIKVGLPTCDVIVDEIKENSTEEFGEFDCVDRTTNDSFILRKCVDTLDVCSVMRCVQKCCPDGQIFFNSWDQQCTEGYRGINLTELAVRGATEFPEDDFAIVNTNQFFDLILLDDSLHPSYLNRKGLFSYIDRPERINLTNDDYCIEYVDTMDDYLCFINQETIEQYGFNYYFYIQLISAILLVITITVYCIVLNEVEKIFGIILVNYCLAMLIWYADMALCYLIVNAGSLDVILAFIVMFARTATFVWANVLCCDIWYNFGCRSTSRYNDTFNKNTSYKTIILYCVYGWGAPMVLMLIIYSFYIYSEILPDVIQPHIEEDACFLFNGNYSQLLFMDIPIILLQVVNIVLFVKTTMYCLKVKNNISKLNDNNKKEHFERNKAKLKLILKLLVMMGVAFISDAITTSFSLDGRVPEAVDILFNIISTAQGIFIFIILICNRQIYNNMKKKLGISNTSSITSTQAVATITSHL